MNLEWQNPNTETPKPVEETEQVKREQNLEQELSPEQIEQIMAKVQDVNKIGTAYSALSQSGLERILNEGFLGNNWTLDKESWAKKIRKEKEGIVFFNIVGTENTRPSFNKTTLENYNAIAESFYMKEMQNEVAIIFDLKPFSPAQPHKYKYATGEKHKNRTFQYDRKNVEVYLDEDTDEDIAEEDMVPGPELAKKIYETGEYFNLGTWNKRGTIDNIKKDGLLDADYEYNENDWPLWIPKVETELGFTLSYRVPPRLFKGIVFQPRTEPQDQDKSESQNIEGKAMKIVSAMKESFGVKAALYMPIYDISGNLLWPKKMSHEEIKKFVEERDTKNTNKEGK